MTKLDVPVLIVGGGGAGLTASMLLSKLGVESLLVSALPSTSILPKAHVLNQRCMEIFTDLGVAEEIYERGTPAENMRYSAYYAGLAGGDPVYGRQLRVYVPGTRPGAPLPHVEVDDLDGHRHPIMDLVRPGRFLLIAGEDGAAWCDAAASLAKQHALPLDAVRIGHLDGDWRDPRCAWLRRREITRRGAVLVRPDRFVAWRSLEAAADPAAVLGGALSQILGRTLGARS